MPTIDAGRITRIKSTVSGPPSAERVWLSHENAPRPFSIDRTQPEFADHLTIALTALASGLKIAAEITDGDHCRSIEIIQD